MLCFVMTILFVFVYGFYYFTRINRIFYYCTMFLNSCNSSVIFYRIWRTISNTPLHSFYTTMLNFQTIKSILYLIKNILNSFSGSRRKFHEFRMFGVPVKYFIQISFSPTKSPPITNHLHNIIVWHFKNSL